MGLVWNLIELISIVRFGPNWNGNWPGLKFSFTLRPRNQPLCGNVRIEAWLHATDAAAAPRDRRDGGFDATGTAAAHSSDDDPPRCLLPGEDLLSSFPLLSSALAAPNSRPRSRSSPLSHRDAATPLPSSCSLLRSRIQLGSSQAAGPSVAVTGG